jgi:hypothetical protein
MIVMMPQLAKSEKHKIRSKITEDSSDSSSEDEAIEVEAAKEVLPKDKSPDIQLCQADFPVLHLASIQFNRLMD